MISNQILPKFGKTRNLSSFFLFHWLGSRKVISDMFATVISYISVSTLRLPTLLILWILFGQFPGLAVGEPIWANMATFQCNVPQAGQLATSQCSTPSQANMASHHPRLNPQTQQMHPKILDWVLLWRMDAISICVSVFCDLGGVARCHHCPAGLCLCPTSVISFYYTPGLRAFCVFSFVILFVFVGGPVDKFYSPVSTKKQSVWVQLFCYLQEMLPISFSRPKSKFMDRIAFLSDTMLKACSWCSWRV